MKLENLLPFTALVNVIFISPFQGYINNVRNLTQGVALGYDN